MPPDPPSCCMLMDALVTWPLQNQSFQSCLALGHSIISMPLLLQHTYLRMIAAGYCLSNTQISNAHKYLTIMGGKCWGVIVEYTAAAWGTVWMGCMSGYGWLPDKKHNINAVIRFHTRWGRTRPPFNPSFPHPKFSILNFRWGKLGFH